LSNFAPANVYLFKRQNEKSFDTLFLQTQNKAKHYWTAKHLTLLQLLEKTGASTPAISLIENEKEFLQ
jgi:hypothetical protein